jgi:hypothetical protein
MRFAFAFGALATVALACSSSSNGGSSNIASQDGGAEGGDAAYPPGDPNKYPSFTPEMAKVVSQGGALLTAPKIVTVTWMGDPNAATYEAFGDAIGTSDYWKALSEYGIGAATSGASRHVRIPDAPPTSMTTDLLDSYVAMQVANAATSGWPANDPNTVYMIYLPQQTVLDASDPTAGCDAEQGFHDETGMGAVQHIVYAVTIQQCQAGDATIVASETQTASHELVEAATDPHTQTDLAYVAFDDDHYAFDQWAMQQDEVADACENYDPRDIYEQTTAFPYSIQRYWSNASAAAGHNPCVPHPLEPYYNVTPLDEVPIAINDKSHKLTSKGFEIPVGTTGTVHLGFYSDAPVDDWQMNVFEGDSIDPVTTKHLAISIDKTSGKNGDVATVSITVNSAAASNQDFILVTAVSSAKGQPPRYMPFLIKTD